MVATRAPGEPSFERSTRVGEDPPPARRRASRSEGALAPTTTTQGVPGGVGGGVGGRLGAPGGSGGGGHGLEGRGQARSGSRPHGDLIDRLDGGATAPLRNAGNSFALILGGWPLFRRDTMPIPKALLLRGPRLAVAGAAGPIFRARRAGRGNSARTGLLSRRPGGSREGGAAGCKGMSSRRAGQDGPWIDEPGRREGQTGAMAAEPAPHPTRG